MQFSQNSENPPLPGWRRGKLPIRDIAEYGETLNRAWGFESQQLSPVRQEGGCHDLHDGQTLLHEEADPSHVGVRGVHLRHLRPRGAFSMTPENA